MMNNYNFRTGREEKQRSIKDLHDLYLRAKTRSISRQSVSMDIIDEIVENIPATEYRGKKTYITYFYENDLLYQWEMSYYNECDSYGISSNKVEFKGTVEEIRTQTIKIITSLDQEFELGEKYKKFKTYNRNLHRRVMHYLTNAINESLIKMYKDVRIVDIPAVIPVNIDDHQYIFHANSNSSRCHKSFVLIGEMEVEPIVME